jgi:hypothetical protein
VKKKKPKRLFRDQRVAPYIKQLVDGLTGDPAVRGVLYTTVAALEDPEVGAVFARSSPGNRGGILTAVLHAVEHLRDGRRCDTCPARATRVRPLVVRPSECAGIRRPDDDCGMVGFAVACAACAAIPAAEYCTRAVVELARLQDRPDYDPRRHTRPVVEGQRVGDIAGLPPRASLRTCERCSETIWCDQDFHDWVGDPREPVAFLCRQCALEAAADGTSVPIPTVLIA